MANRFETGDGDWNENDRHHEAKGSHTPVEWIDAFLEANRASLGRSRALSEHSKRHTSLHQRESQSSLVAQGFRVTKNKTAKPWMTRRLVDSGALEVDHIQETASVVSEEASLSGAQPRLTHNGVELSDLQMRKHRIAYDESALRPIIKKLAKRQHNRLQKHYSLEGKTLDPEECWFDTNLPHANQSKIRVVAHRHIHWRENDRHFPFDANLGIVMLLDEDHMNDREKGGFIWEDWQPSHLCGNWPCINFRHLVMEAKKVNLSRNPCFRRPDCDHSPRCMKELKKKRDELRVADPARTDQEPSTDQEPLSSLADKPAIRLPWY